MRQAVVGLLAHVDAGKTTLAEALLYRSGAIRSAGRVDHGDAHLDYEPVERERGITVFSKQADLVHHDVRLTLLDAPGHVDFSAEAERTLQVLDLAVLVVGANDGVQGHTRTLWRLLERHGVPTVVFINKTDLVDVPVTELVQTLGEILDATCVDVSQMGDPEVQEQMAMADEGALEEYLEEGALAAKTVEDLVRRRLVFPCVCGSALRMDGGVDRLLDCLCSLAADRPWPEDFGARVFKVSHGRQGERITWVKVTGGSLRAKEVLHGVMATGDSWTDKVDQLRLYSCGKYEVVTCVDAGRVCAVVGLAHALPGDGLGAEGGGMAPAISPVLDYRVIPEGGDPHAVYAAIRELSEEDPQLAVSWSEELQEIRLRLMGPIQQELVQRELRERHGLEVAFGPGSILYKETILSSVEGIGHFEPLRHYAEAHLMLEPEPRGTGVVVGTRCGTDELDLNWQRLILTHVLERDHRGTLVGAPLTDVRVTLLGGRAHPKHTEGGDFRQATYRAIRQGLMQADSQLLEPWYRFVLDIPTSKVGRALADVQRMGARFEAPAVTGEMATIEGSAPVSELRDYDLQVRAYTSGSGSLSLEFSGYEPCHDADRVISEAAYDPRADLSNTPDSVFCSHGAGYTVAWDEVASHAHVTIEPTKLRPWRAADAAFFSHGANPQG